MKITSIGLSGTALSISAANSTVRCVDIIAERTQRAIQSTNIVNTAANPQALNILKLQ